MMALLPTTASLPAFYATFSERVGDLPSQLCWIGARKKSPGKARRFLYHKILFMRLPNGDVAFVLLGQPLMNYSTLK